MLSTKNNKSVSLPLFITLCVVVLTTFASSEPPTFHLICVSSVYDCPDHYKLLQEKERFLCGSKNVCYKKKTLSSTTHPGSRESDGLGISEKNSLPQFGSIFASRTLIGMGTFISRRHVLTSARVLRDYEDESSDLYVNLEGLTMDIRVKSVEIHKRYQVSFDLSTNNIAVIELQRSVDVTPMTLANFIPRAHTRCLAPALADAGHDEDVHLKTMSQQSCQQKLKNFVTFVLPKGYLCAETVGRNRKNPPIVLGAPLISKRDDVWYLSGLIDLQLTSNERTPYVFSEVTQYKNWIKSVLHT